MITIVSKFAGTPVVPAKAGGPYKVPQGTPLTLTAGNTHPSATHTWDLGDGTTATGPSVTHTYPVPGFYVVKLATVVNQPGGARTRDFAELTVEDVPPAVDAGPDRTVDEGSPLTLTGSFSDPGWLDTHEAEWFWGDDAPPTAGAVAEKHDPPAGKGESTATHTWGDAGKFTVVLLVRDQHGGVGRDEARVTVRNVPPTVDAGPPVFAYPGTPITLEGRFTDPGWLDLHEGTWDFGDGSRPQMATIYETHAPPVGTGAAVASHVYRHLGCHCASCTVVDDDGGTGTGVRTVHVVDVRNRRFEEGFRATLAGTVAKEWETYAATVAEFAAPSRLLPLPAGTFAAEEYVVGGGQRSQRIRTTGQSRAGVYQRIGANPGWCYEIAAWYCLFETGGGMARLGVHPAGGVDPTDPAIVWITGRSKGTWESLTARVRARKDGITIFLEATGKYRLTHEEEEAISEDPAAGAPAASDLGAEACFDRVSLLPFQPICEDCRERPADHGCESDGERPPERPPDKPPERPPDKPPERPPGKPPERPPTDRPGDPDRDPASGHR